MSGGGTYGLDRRSTFGGSIFWAAAAGAAAAAP
jgi:hypothetical protein